MWKLTIEDDQGNRTVVNLVRDEYTIGRAEQNAVRLTERNISRNHARIHKSDGKWLVEDLNSYNGCYANGVRVGEPQPLEHGDLVQLGDYRLEITDDAVAAVAAGGSAQATIPVLPRSQALLGQPDRLVMLVGPTPGAEFPLVGERIVIGRGEECDVPINHGSVSRVHAEVRSVGNGRYELIDRESANGVRVNGVELQRALIDSRDMIELGDVVLKFIPAGQIYLPGAEESQQLGAYGFGPMDRVSSAPGVEARPPPSRGLPSSVKVVGGVLVLGVLIVLGMITFRGSGDNAATAPNASTETDPTLAALERAKQLLSKGDFEGAHRLVLAQIPESSNARQSDDFKHVEARWADSLLAQADTEQDPATKRDLLDRVAKAPTVDSVRRKRASTEMAALDDAQGGGVEVTELPSAPQAVKVAEKPAATSSGGLVRTNPFDSPAPAAATTHHVAAPKPAPAGTGSLNNEAASGDRAKQVAAKNALKAKVARGQATDQDKRILRALCRQYGDMSCAY